MEVDDIGGSLASQLSGSLRDPVSKRKKKGKKKSSLKQLRRNTCLMQTSALHMYRHKSEHTCSHALTHTCTHTHTHVCVNSVRKTEKSTGQHRSWLLNSKCPERLGVLVTTASENPFVCECCVICCGVASLFPPGKTVLLLPKC